MQTKAKRSTPAKPSAPETLTKRQLVERVAALTERNQCDIQTIVQCTLDCMRDALVGGQNIEFRDFGVFQVALRRARIGRNPRRPSETVTIPPHRTVKFRPGKEMKALLLSHTP